MCFQKDGKTAQVARCIKSRITNNLIDYVLSIDTFEQQYVMLKGMLQSPRLKYRIHTIGTDQSLSNNAIYEHKCLGNIKKLYRQSGKCDNQKQFKDIIEAGMVSTPEIFTNDIPISPMTLTPVKKPRAQKSLCLFNNILDMKKTAPRRVGDVKSKRKAIKYVNTPWAFKQKRKGN